MPFGSNPKTYQTSLGRDEYGPHLTSIPGHRVDVEYGEPPPWWSEYLIEEWKRTNHYKQQPRDGRSQWQRKHDEWAAQLRSWDLQDFGLIGNKPGLTRPPHDVWGNKS